MLRPYLARARSRCALAVDVAATFRSPGEGVVARAILEA